MELKLSLEVTSGLKRVGNATLIHDDVFSRLLVHTSGTLTQPDLTGASGGNFSPGASKGDVLKDAHCALLSLFVEGARQDFPADSLQVFLETKVSWPKSRSNQLCNAYVIALPKIQALLSNVGFHPPHVVDVNWSLSHNVKSSSVEHTSGALVNVQLDSEGNNSKNKNVGFVCTLPELQDLVSKLKEALRQIEHVGQLNHS